eukprot:6197672-Pleurochrysis_carterae.AAC.4
MFEKYGIATCQRGRSVAKGSPASDDALCTRSSTKHLFLSLSHDHEPSYLLALGVPGSQMSAGHLPLYAP